MNLSGGVNVEKLSDSNYETWKVQMRSVLIFNDLWDCVKNSDTCSKVKEEEEKKKWLAKDEKALALILLAVKENQITYIKKAKTSAEAWKTLENIHSSKGPAKKVLLYKQLFLMKKKCEQSMTDHLRNFQNYVDQMEEIGVIIPKELLSIMLLNTLPEEYENFCVAVESRDNLPELEALKVKLMEEENRRNNTNEEKYDPSSQNALLSKQNNHTKKQKRKEFNDKRGHRTQNSNMNKTNHFNGTCFNCGKPGHKADKCWTKKKAKNKHKNAAMNTILSAESINQSEWCIDSGASAHMCRDSKMFSSWDIKTRSTIQTAGNEKIESFGVGTVVLKLFKTKGHVETLTLKDVIYVPKLRHNLLSVSKATKSGYVFIFNNQFAIVKDKHGSVIFRAKRKGKLYTLETNEETLMISIEKSDFDLIKWHQRLGHLNFKDIEKLKHKNLVTGLEYKIKQSDVKCMTCNKGKIVQVYHRKSEIRESDLLELVHSDICGPFNTQSLGGSKYFVTFVDSKSRFVDVTFLKHRSEVFEAFKNYQRWAERQTGRKVKCLRTDNAKEYKSKEFEKYLENLGIKRQFSVEYTPQQNGVAERMNKTLLDMARCMLIEADLPNSLWAEAVNTAAFIRNRCPTASNEKTPYEIWTGKKPNVSFLRSFGSKAIALNKGPKKSKLDARGEEFVFVGYSKESKGYRLWDGKTRSIVVRCDVKILEKTDPKNYFWAEGNIHSEEEKTEDECYEESVPEIKMNNSTAEDESEDVENNDQKDTENFKTPETTPRRLISDMSDPLDGFSDEEIGEAKDDKEKRKPGRPKIHRTGLRGRPKKIFSGLEQVNIAVNSVNNNPISFEEAMARHDRSKWAEAMADELKSLRKNNTWELVDRPVGKKVLSNRWVFCIKYASDGSVDKYKARLVVRGCEQESGVDYDEVFAPVARYESLRVLFAICGEKEMYLHQMDVISAYVQGELDDELYMEQPRYPDERSNNSKVCKLMKPLYGLKQAGRQWYKKLNEYLKNIGMRQTASDNCLYEKDENGKKIIILVYVDDLLLASNCIKLLEETKNLLSTKFEMKDLGEVKNILGISVKREGNIGKIEINQSQYIRKILKRFKMEDAKPMSTPIDANQKMLKDTSTISKEEQEEMNNIPYRELIGALMYLSNTTRPDISFAVNMLSRYCVQPRLTHWKMSKRILRYLKNTIDYSIKYEKVDQDVKCYVDSDWASDQNDRKSCSGYVVFLGGGPICWKSMKQKSVSLSTMEAEYVALSEATKEIVYLRRLLGELKVNMCCSKPTTIFCDNQSAIKLSKENLFHQRSKHIDIRYHFCREKQNEGSIKVVYLPTDKMVADIFTKSLQKTKHEICVNLLGLRNLES